MAAVQNHVDVSTSYEVTILFFRTSKETVWTFYVPSKFYYHNSNALEVIIARIEKCLSMLMPLVAIRVKLLAFLNF